MLHLYKVLQCFRIFSFWAIYGHRNKHTDPAVVESVTVDHNFYTVCEDLSSSLIVEHEVKAFFVEDSCAFYCCVS